MENENRDYAETYLGTFGAFLPLIVMIITLVILSIMGLSSTQNFMCAGILGLFAGMLVYKDKSRFGRAVTEGVRNPTLAMLIQILIAAGILSKILTASGMSDSFVAVLTYFKVPAGMLPVITFIIAACISTASGSSSTTNVALIPVVLPISVQMGASGLLTLTAIISGSVFGDNLAPISDTTIASTLSVGADMGRAVRSRIKYSIAAGIPSALLFLFFGYRWLTGNGVGEITASSSLFGLIYIILPVMLIVMILRKADFLFSFLLTNFVGIIMLLVFNGGGIGIVLGEESVIVTGIEGMVDPIIFMLLIFVVLSLTDDTGCIYKMTSFFERFAKSPRSAEGICGLFMCLTVAITTEGTSSMAFCGPIIKKILEPFNVTPERMSNFIDGLGCAVSNLLPYGMMAVTCVSIAISMGVVPETTTAIDLVTCNFFPILLFLVYWIAILTGWGRETEGLEKNSKRK